MHLQRRLKRIVLICWSRLILSRAWTRRLVPRGLLWAAGRERRLCALGLHVVLALRGALVPGLVPRASAPRDVSPPVPVLHVVPRDAFIPRALAPPCEPQPPALPRDAWQPLPRGLS